MKKIAVLVAALFAVPASAQEGTVYRCTKDGVRNYTLKPIAGADCAAIKYSLDSSSSGWIPYGQDDDLATYYRSKGIERKGSIVSIWMMDNFPDQQILQNQGYYHSTIGRWEIDCSSQKYQPIQSTYYSLQLGQGKPIGTLNYPMPLRYAVPGSIGEMMVETAYRVSRELGRAESD